MVNLETILLVTLIKPRHSVKMTYLHRLTHAVHNTGRTSYTWPAAISVHQGNYGNMICSAQQV